MKRIFRMPTAYSILLAIIVVMAVLTFLLPAGQYEYNDNGEPIAGTYHQVENNGRVFGAVVSPLWNVCMRRSDIAVFIHYVGGFLRSNGENRRH